jgi:hypothetical protein
MAHPIHPHSERSRHSRRRLAAAPHGEGTHDAGSEIVSLLSQGIDIEPIREMCACRSAFSGAARKECLGSKY